VQPKFAPFGRAAASRELHRIAEWWLRNTTDTVNGGFVGRVEHDGRRVEGADKGVVLNSRILWFFSEIARADRRPGYRESASRAFAYLLEHFDDPHAGGAVWKLSADGRVSDGKKQVYAQAFCIYALAAYYRLTGERLALNKALEYFELLETRARDGRHGGYLDAFSRDWRPLDNMRLDDADLNAPKSMNSHLHLLEAYTALHLATRSARTEAALRHAVDVLCDRVFDAERGHLSLFFDLQWRRLSAQVSFGHDIEASWLLWEAVEALADPQSRQRAQPVVERLAERCLQEGVGALGQLCESADPARGTRSDTGVWWVQAEALVGFLNACELTGDPAYGAAADRIWRYIGVHLLDTAAGEWRWQFPIGSEPRYLAGFWKGPYHNGRAMLEAGRRCKALGRA
jgi:mannobiose 2-epimerase